MSRQLEQLLDKYKKLMGQSHKLSTKNRKEADLKFSEAQQLLMKIEKLKNS